MGTCVWEKGLIETANGGQSHGTAAIPCGKGWLSSHGSGKPIDVARLL